MENLSKMTIDDSSTSMYYSFNSTTANKTVEAMETAAEISCAIVEEEGEQNTTLEAEEKYEASEQLQTVKKLSFGVSPMKSIPKNILKAYKALSSTPTKAQLLRSVEVTRGSAAVDVCDLGLAFLEAPQECINAVLLEDKENQPQESQEIYSETSSEIVVSVIEKTQDEVQPVVKRVGFSNLPVLKGSGNMNIRCTPKLRRSVAQCEPDLISNRPSRITSKRMSIAMKAPIQQPTEFTSGEIPKMINSMLKIAKELPAKRKSFGNPDKPFNLVGKATRMSIVKTTLNSPARKVSRKSITSFQIGRQSMRRSVLPINKQKSVAPESTAVPRKIELTTHNRKSMLPTTVTSPKKRIISMNSRKSMIPEKPSTSSMIPTTRKSMAPKPSTSAGQEAHSRPFKLKKPPGDLKEDYVCEVCSRKFRVLSLFEAHKRTHSTAATSTKQTFSGNDKQCPYCDRKFAIAKALTNHLVQNCTKIPPGDKKKLLFPTAQTLKTVAHPNSKMPPKSISNLSSCDTDKLLTHSHHDIGDRSMLPPSITKTKKKLAHSGVYCTPNKEIPCHVCKINFSNILAYTEHSLSHSTVASPEETVPTFTESTETQADVKNYRTQPLQEENVVALN